MVLPNPQRSTMNARHTLVMWFTRKTAPPGCVTADRNDLILRINKNTLRSLGDSKSLTLLAALQGNNDGDWGGADYPEHQLTARQVCTLVPELAAALPASKMACVYP
jgi:hypothetical protein